MSTQLEDREDHWVVSTVAAPGGRKRMARGHVAVPKGDDDALKAEMLKQAVALRVEAGVSVPPSEAVA